MSLHARLMIRYPEDNEIPPEPFALIEMRLDDIGDHYYPSRITLVNGTEVKFRVGQIHKRYDKTRSICYLIVAHIVESNESHTYDILERLPEIRTWKCMVSWYSVVEEVEQKVASVWGRKIAGYDGPFTTG